MDRLKKEIKDELSRPRLDKTRLYDLLLRIVDEVGEGGGSAQPGPKGDRGEKGDRGDRGEKGEKGEAGTCKCACVAKSDTPVKKTRSTKKAAPAPEAAPEQ